MRTDGMIQFYRPSKRLGGQYLSKGAWAGVSRACGTLGADDKGFFYGSTSAKHAHRRRIECVADFAIVTW